MRIMGEGIHIQLTIKSDLDHIGIRIIQRRVWGCFALDKGIYSAYIVPFCL